MQKSKGSFSRWFFLPLVIFLVCFIGACRDWDNFTTYYNTYYNTDRLIGESEEEFSFQDEKRRIKPRVFVPEPVIKFQAVQKGGTPSFMNEFIIDQQKLQPVQTKLDSVIVKGSKILAKHPKSSYAEGAILLMAKAYFYRREWLPAQIKCSELIDRYPLGDLNPDAHLLLSKCLLIQQKYLAGQIMLSRTVDIAWYKKRYDILSEAFRLEAELALFQEDVNGALSPYRQAIAQSEDEGMRAKWKIDLGALLYRVGRYKESLETFRTVHSSSPDYVGEFEAWIYEAECLVRLGRFKEADVILNRLDEDGKYEEWKASIFAVRMNSLRFQKKDAELAVAEKKADSAYANNPAILAVYYEIAMDNFKKNDYINSRKYYSRIRTQKTDFAQNSDKMFTLLNNWEMKKNQATNLTQKIGKNPNAIDGDRSQLALALYELGRIHEQLNNKDSVTYYYKAAADNGAVKDTATAKYLYAYSRMIQKSDPAAADSLMEVLVARYPRTVYGREALQRQGYTADYLIDTVAELYKSGSSLFKSHEYILAINQFQKVLNDYPKSDFAPRSVYSLGWIYEKNMRIIDSALYYYKILIDKYPTSDYTKDVKPGVDQLLAFRSGKLTRDTSKFPTDTSKKNQLIDPSKLLQKKALEPSKDTTKRNKNELIPGVDSPLSDPNFNLKNRKIDTDVDLQLKPDIQTNLPFDPFKLFKSSGDSTAVKDGQEKPKDSIKQDPPKQDPPKITPTPKDSSNTNGKTPGDGSGTNNPSGTGIKKDSLQPFEFIDDRENSLNEKI